MSLFKLGDIALHSGGRSIYKIECDALDAEDWTTLAAITAARKIFNVVIGVPRGGLRFAEALKPHCTPGSNVILICDDVFTTGRSMEELRSSLRRAKRPLLIQGVVVFARCRPPDWIYPLFVRPDTDV